MRLIRQIKNLRHLARGLYYAQKYDHPSRKLKVIGVTGTDGKTTTSTVLFNILRKSGLKAGLITTINAQIGDERIDTGFHVTNPPSELLQKLLAQAVEKGIEYMVLETTSHGIDQHRIAGISYHAALYTNVTKEHLDYHKTYEHYLYTKSRLIGRVENGGFIVLNRDSDAYEYLKKAAVRKKLKTVAYGFHQESDVLLSDFTQKERSGGIEFKVENSLIKSNLNGQYNASNLGAAISAALELDVPMNKIQNALLEIEGLEGRWDLIQSDPFQVVVDFAHTPNALTNLLTLARQTVAKANGRVIVAFGCTGSRDRSKRPVMGEIAERLADRVIVTSDDLWAEKFEDIAKEILAGVKAPENVETIGDRREAVERALTLAKPGDIVVLAGKGHEKTINVGGDREVEWSDQEVAREILNLK